MIRQIGAPSGYYRPSELVREYLPLISDRDAGYVLWNLTAYPMDSIDGMRVHLAECAAACAPVRKRGWHRKLWRFAAKTEAELMVRMRMDELREQELSDGAKQVEPPAAIDPVGRGSDV